MTREQLLTTNGVAALLSVHPKHVYRLLKRGLPARRLGGEWRYEAEAVLQWMSSNARREPPPLVAANGDVCVELLLDALSRATRAPVGLVQADRTSGRAFLERGGVLAAGVHGEGERPQRAVVRVHLTRRTLCLAYVKGRRLRSLRSLPGLRLASRAPTAGVRAHLDRVLVEDGLDSEEIHENSLICASHGDVALRVLSAQADAGVLTVAWAERAGLGILPIADEDYSLSLRSDSLSHELGRALVRTLQSKELKRALSRTAGYEPRDAGALQ